jgi:outer membrane protein assembly factor BamB
MKLLALIVSLALGWPCAWPDGQGNAYTTNKLSPGSPQVAWSVALGKTATPPCVAGDKVMVGTSNAAVCYNITDGTKVWMVEMPGQIIAPPAQLAGRAIFCDNTGSVISVDVEKGTIEDRLSVGARVTAPPVVYGGSLYIATNAGIVTKATPNLKEEFSTDLAMGLLVSPLVHPTGIIQTTPLGDVYTLSDRDGKIISQMKVLPQSSTIQPCAKENLINFTSDRIVSRMKDGIPINIDLPWEATCQVGLPVGRLAIGTKRGLIMIDGDKIAWKTETANSITAMSSNDDVIVIGTSAGEIIGFDHKGNSLWNVLVSGSVAHPICIVEGGILASSGNSLNFFQFWDLNPKPSFIDLGYVPTGEVAEGVFSMTNPANSPGDAVVTCNSENEFLSVTPASVTIKPGKTISFTVRLNSEGFKEGRYQGTVTIRTASAIYKVNVGFTIVPQPFVAKLVLGNSVMKMSRGVEKWDVTLDVAPYLKNNRTMVPLRAISESFGPKVSYFKNGCGSSDRVDITLGNTVISHCIGTAAMTKRVSGKVEPTPTFDTPSEIRSGRTFVPIRFIAEAFKASVSWDQKTRTVTIVYSP